MLCQNDSLNASILNRRFTTEAYSSDNITSQRLYRCRSLYRKTFFGHYGCVNTVTFSTSQSQFVSSGDDGRVLIWNTAACISDRNFESSLHLMGTKHLSNVFSACFNCDDSLVLSGGNDQRLLVQDVAENKLLNDIEFSTAQVFSVNSHPRNSALSIAGGSSGKIYLIDLRDKNTNDISNCRNSNESLKLLSLKESVWSLFRCVKFNPADPNYFAAASSTKGVTLRDVRKTNQIVAFFKPRGHEKISCSDRELDVMHCCFDQLGSQLLVQSGRESALYLYDVINPEHPKVCFSNRGYRNKTTVKACSFLGPNDEYVVSGSDDFNVYVWKIPKDETKTQVWVSHLQLKGHRSVVNQVNYSTRYNVLATSGAEKVVKFWSPYYINHGMGDIEKETGVTRKRFKYADYVNFCMSRGSLHLDSPDESTEEDPRILAFFDIGGDRSIDSDTDDCFENSDFEFGDDLPLVSQRSPFDLEFFEREIRDGEQLSPDDHNSIDPGGLFYRSPVDSSIDFEELRRPQQQEPTQSYTTSSDSELGDFYLVTRRKKANVPKGRSKKRTKALSRSGSIKGSKKVRSSNGTIAVGTNGETKAEDSTSSSTATDVDDEKESNDGEEEDISATPQSALRLKNAKRSKKLGWVSSLADSESCDLSANMSSTSSSTSSCPEAASCSSSSSSGVSSNSGGCNDSNSSSNSNSSSCSDNIQQNQLQKVATDPQPTIEQEVEAETIWRASMTKKETQKVQSSNAHS